jgi:hypothetical protein
MALWRKLFSVNTPPETENRLATLEGQMRDIRAEWADREEKFLRLYARIRKRIEREEEAAPAAPGETAGAPIRVLPPSRRGF